MAACAIHRQAERHVVRVRRAVEIGGVAGRTVRRRVLEARGVARQALRRRVRPGQREGRGVVVEDVRRIARRVAGEAGRAAVRVAAYASVLVVGFGVGVAGGASHLGVVGRVGVAVHAGIPLTVVRPGVDGEILRIVVEAGRHPSALAVAACAIRRELRRLVVGVRGGRILRRVAAEAVVGRREIVAVVAGGALVRNHCVSAIQRVKIIVQRKSRRLPIGHGRVAEGAVVGQGQRHVVRVQALVEIRRVAARTVGGRGRVVAADVAGRTVVGYRNMLARERPNRVVVKRGRHPSRLRVAGRAVRGELVRHVVRVGHGVEVRGVAARASVRRVHIVPVVASGAVVRNRCVSAIQRIKIVVVGEAGRCPAGVGGVAACAII